MRTPSATLLALLATGASTAVSTCAWPHDVIASAGVAQVSCSSHNSHHSRTSHNSPSTHALQTRRAAHPLDAHGTIDRPPAPRDYSPRPTVDSMDLFSSPVSDASSAALPAQVKSRPDHPLKPMGIADPPSRRSAGPLQTNKFYANLLLGTQDLPAYLMPYTVSWTKGRGPTNGWGLTVSYVTPEQRVFGPTDGPCHHHSSPNSYYFSPPIVQNLVLDAAELNSHTALTVENPTDMAAMVSLRPGGPASAPAVQFPLVQGQGLITGVYNGSRPILRTAQAILSVNAGSGSGSGPTSLKPGVDRFVLQMNDSSTWLLYARSLPGTAPLDLHQSATSVLEARGAFHGSIQVTRVLNPGQGWTSYDHAAGVFATGVTLSGHTSSGGTVGTYNFTYTKADVAGDTAFQAGSPLLMYALPHHYASFDGRTQAATLSIAMQTTTKGPARAVLGDSWTMVEPELPTSLAFLPWDPKTRQTVSSLSSAAHQTIAQVASQELAEDMNAQTDLESMYYSGKGLAKFASIVLVVSELLHDAAAAASGLAKLKASFARFAENRQKHPLVYEGTWGGVVSTASYTANDPNVDFGNSYYNDHHFHYGYFVLAGAIIAHLDPSWLPANAAFVDMLVRDYSNPSSKDQLFPVFRSFDWYHGHSWAHGLFPSMDGKDQESSSEDAMSIYAIKLWGLAKGDAVMEARGNLMLSVLARSLQTYYYYEQGNTAEPAGFVGNQVGGIVFENKIDHTTYFGTAPEFIHGIHMLPLLPCSPFFRKPSFVTQEWDDIFANGQADKAQGGWLGVLYGNLATISPRAAYQFFSQARFSPSSLDGGASRTWYLSYAAALGGA